MAKKLIWCLEFSMREGYSDILAVEETGEWWRCVVSVGSDRQPRITDWEKITTYGAQST